MEKIANQLKTNSIQTKYPGVRKTAAGNYEISYYAFKGAWRKSYKTVEGKSDKEASDKRQAALVESRSKWQSGVRDGERLLVSFERAWLDVERGLVSDKLPEKTKKGYKRVYDRIFDDFRKKYYPNVQFPCELNLPFFIGYKDYFCNDLDRVKGLRTELIIAKAIIKRLYTLGFCSDELLRKLKEIKKPKRIEKDYPEISKEDMQQYLMTIKAARPDLWRPIFFMYVTGRRVEETTLIERRDVVWSNLEPVGIHIKAETTKTKTKSSLDYLDSNLKNLINWAYQESKDHKSPYLFLNRQNNKCNQRKITDYLRETSSRILKVKITSHYFRHRFMTECQRNGIPIVDAQAVCGLKDINVALKYYSHHSAEQQKKALEMMNF